MPKPPISPDKLGKFRDQGGEVTDPVVNGITVIGTFQKFDFTGGKGKVKDLNFLGNGDNEYVIFGAGNDVAIMGGGDDIVVGGAGDDNLNGGEGDDFIEGARAPMCCWVDRAARPTAIRSPTRARLQA